ncbi:hypothetical protein [Kingella oralis]
MEWRRLVAKWFIQQGLLVGKMSASRRRAIGCRFCNGFQPICRSGIYARQTLTYLS